MYYICDKFGFVSDFYRDTNHYGVSVLKAKHCLDVREALPFKNRGAAESAFRNTYMADWWHCVLGTSDQERMAAANDKQSNFVKDTSHEANQFV